jgi:precorrin-6Y C5,15-methyltransferase (decarboxylating)
VPFSTAPVLAQRGRRVAVLASGDPFWFGAGGSLVPDLRPGEWVSLPAPSTFSLAASRLGWRLEDTICLGLHAVPFARLRGHLAEGVQILCLLRDADAPKQLAAWLVARGFGDSELWVLQALGGPRERIVPAGARGFAVQGVIAPVALAIRARGQGIAATPGLPDDSFAHDGQITKAPIRALTLAALGPRRGEMLWDIGSGSGSVSVEWCRSAHGARAIAIEARAARVDNIRANAAAFALDGRIEIIEGRAPAVLDGLSAPDAVFLGGGSDEPLLMDLWARLRPGTRLVANAVTLETEALFARWSAERGGGLTRIDIATAAPLGRMRGWNAARPVVQWSVTL